MALEGEEGESSLIIVFLAQREEKEAWKNLVFESALWIFS